MTEAKKVRVSKKERMPIFSVRVPPSVIEYFHSNFKNSSVQVREILEKFIEEDKRGNHT